MSDTRALYLVRHAIAFDHGDDWPDDAKRPLTPKGIERMREVASGFRALDVALDVIITSPLVRAKQTADILVSAHTELPLLVQHKAMAPGAPRALLADALSKHHDADSIALVGHEPSLGELAAWLIGAKQPIPFKKGGIARLGIPAAPRVVRAGCAQLVWAATPRMLRALSK